jgi:UV DNA damage endonuclease
LVIENDDKASQYSVKDLYDLLYKEINIPITFDSHHHKFCSGNLTHEEAAKLAASTWGNVPAGFHFSSTINHESPTQMARAHADWIYEDITDWGTGAWIMVEAKLKEKSIISYMKEGVKTSDFVETFELINS